VAVNLAMPVDLIDEIWLTVCPLILGGTAAPPVEGAILSTLAPRLEPLSVQAIAQEVFFALSSATTGRLG